MNEYIDEEEYMKKDPIRTCVGCGCEFDKRDLIRIVRQKEGNILIDFSNKLNGRGVYLCNDTACLDAAIKNKKISKSLKSEIEPKIYEQLRKEITNGQQN